MKIDQPNPDPTPISAEFAKLAAEAETVGELRSTQGDRRVADGQQLELISDGDGLAVIGTAADVDRFLSDQGLERAPSKALDVHRCASLLGRAGVAAQVGSELAENSGRWVKLTAESATDVKKLGLMPTETPGVSHAMIGKPGRIKQWIQIEKGPALVSGPMALATVAAMMQQRALQQQIDEIVEYLEEIDEKVDDILRGQKDAVLADIIGVDLAIAEALTVRDKVGRVSEVSWSKVQTAGMTIARTQAYAVLQLDAIAEKLEKHANLREIAKATSEAEPKVREWLVVIAQTFRLQNGVAVLELDRVLDASPDELDRHRLGLTAARQKRLEFVGGSTANLLARMDETARTANSKVLLNPFDSPKAVRLSNQITTAVLDFRTRLGIESADGPADPRAWGQAVSEARDMLVAAAKEGALAAKHVGDEAVDRATDAVRLARIDSADESPSAGAGDETAPPAKNAAGRVARSLGPLLHRSKSTETAAQDTTPDSGPSGA